MDLNLENKRLMKYTIFLRISFTVVLLGLVFLSVKQCERINRLEYEIEVIDNNSAALADSLQYYKDSNGLLSAEKLAFQLSVQDLKDSLWFERNKEPITVIKYKTKIVEKIITEPQLVYDTVTHSSQILWAGEKNYGQSSFAFNAVIPYTIQDSTLRLGSSSLDFIQNLWCRASLVYDKRQGNIRVNLATDYPGVTFNETQGILVDDSEYLNNLKYNSRRTWGISIQLGYGISKDGLSPYLGFGISYMPRWLQF